MQIRIDAVPGETAPPETFVSMRVGDVQKQTRFEKTRTYRFPVSSDERGSFGRIEVFKRIGTLTVPLDHYRNGINSVEVPCSYPKFDKLCLNMAVLGGEDPATIKDSNKKSCANKRINEAQQYLSNFNLEDVLADAMREVIRDRPDDPYKYISSYILKQSDPDLIICPPTQSPKPAVERIVAPVHICPRCGYIEGSDSAFSQGGLVSGWSEPFQKPFQKLASVGTWLKQKPIIQEPPRDPPTFKHLPSVGTWLAPVQKQGPLGRPSEIQTDFSDVSIEPFSLRPSVGTWLMNESPPVERPWYYQVRNAGEHTEFLKGLQKVICSKDDEMEQLKKQIAMLQAALSPQPSNVPSPTVAQVALRVPEVESKESNTPQPTLNNFPEFYKSFILPGSKVADSVLSGFAKKALPVAKQPTRASESDLKGAQPDPDLELRQKAKTVLQEAALTGKLGAVMAEVLEDPLLELGQKAHQALKEATLSGKLEEILAGLKVVDDLCVQDPLLELRQQAQRALKDATVSGKLEEVMAVVKGSEATLGPDLQQKAVEALKEATLSGKLEEFMAAVKGSEAGKQASGLGELCALIAQASPADLQTMLSGLAEDKRRMIAEAVKPSPATVLDELPALIAQAIPSDIQAALAKLTEDKKRLIIEAVHPSPATASAKQSQVARSPPVNVLGELGALIAQAIQAVLAGLTEAKKRSIAEASTPSPSNVLNELGALIAQTILNDIQALLSGLTEESAPAAFQKLASVGTWLQTRRLRG